MFEQEPQAASQPVEKQDAASLIGERLRAACDAFAVQLRPLALLPAWCEPLEAVRLVERFRLSVDPAVAESNVDGLVPVDRSDAGLLLRVLHPDTRRLRMMLAQPSFEISGLREELHRVV